MRIITVIILLVAMMSASAAENFLPPVPPKPLPFLQVTYGQSFWLAVGQSAIVKDTNFKLKFDGVSLDYCPPKTKTCRKDIIDIMLTFFQEKERYPVIFSIPDSQTITINGVVDITLLNFGIDSRTEFLPTNCPYPCYLAELAITPHTGR
ncbi:hypothetical protein THII_2612 [Thioploca ingrica]|uniref:Secreted protein n=1 Tax=Thioploca ingrica TaxID=40754 RepID=A0A090AHW4_9GAMM|nr:hypothetical protein THII_2612 [Thioploca ingrica]